MMKRNLCLLTAVIAMTMTGCGLTIEMTEPDVGSASVLSTSTIPEEIVVQTENTTSWESVSQSLSSDDETGEIETKYFASLDCKICRYDQSFDVETTDGKTVDVHYFVDYLEITDATYPYRDAVNNKIREIATSTDVSVDDVRNAVKLVDSTDACRYGLSAYLSYADVYNKNGILSVKESASSYTGGSECGSDFIGFTLDINTGEVMTLSQVLQMDGDNEGVKQVVLNAANSNLDSIPESDINNFQIIDPNDYDFYVREDGMICYSMGTREFGRLVGLGREGLPLEKWIKDDGVSDDVDTTHRLIAEPESSSFCRNLVETYGDDVLIQKIEQPVDCGDYYEVQVEIRERVEGSPDWALVDTPYVRISKNCTVGWRTEPISEISLSDYAERWGVTRDFIFVTRLRMRSVLQDEDGYVTYFEDGYYQ